MNVMPRDRVGQISFCQSHLEKWMENAVQIGVPPEMIAELSNKIDAAREARLAQQEAASAAMAKTAIFHQATDAMAELASNIIRQAKSTAAVEGNQVYSLAMIPSPSGPTPINTLGEVRDVTSSLDSIGAIHLKWKCTNPRGATGTVYQIWRRIGANAKLEFVATAGKKMFVDNTVPAGTAVVIYKLRPVRSTAIGNWTTYTVQFGGTPQELANAFRSKNQTSIAA